jgi:hypothetical protein
MRNPGRSLALVAVVGVVALLAATVLPAGAAPPPGAFRRRILTAQGPRSIFTGAIPSVNVTAAGKAPADPVTAPGDRRELIFPAKARNVANSQVCATWASERGPYVQQGLAFRIRKVPGGHRALAVLKNVLGARSAFNFMVFDTSTPQRYTLLGRVSLAPVLSSVPLPWRVCARLVGSAITFKAWPATRAEPAWNDPAYGGRFAVPAGWSAPGRSGWYIGHLRSTDRAQFTDLSSSVLAG